MSNLFTELKRRNVFRVGFAYVIMAWLLAQVADLVIDNITAPDWIMQVLMLFLAMGFPIALFFAWAFEMTPEGIKREHEVDRSHSITRQTGQKLNTAIIVTMAIAVGFLFFDRFAGRDTGQTADTQSALAEEQEQTISIAVLPFVNMSSDPEQDYFSDGISEEILNLLVRVDGLSVASRTSAFSFKGSTENLADIAETLGVDHILEGSVRKSNDRVRITAQLIDAKRDRHLWSESFDRELTDIFAIQDDISSAIVDALRTTLGVEIEKSVSASVATTNMDAYQVFLKARSLFLYRNPLGLRKSIELFQHAIEMDPGFARAYEGLAAVMVVVHSYPVPSGYESITKNEAHEAAASAARKALEINPALSLPHAVLAQVSLRKTDYAQALQEYDLAIGLDEHDATALLWRGIWSQGLGYIEESLEYLYKAQSLDPASGINNDFLGTSLFILGRREEAMVYLSVAYEHGRPIGYLPFYQGLESSGKMAAIGVLANRLSDEESTLVPYFMRIFDKNGDREKAKRRFFSELDKKPALARAVYEDAELLALIGEYERAANAVDFAGGVGFVRLWWPFHRDFRRSPYFKAMVRERKMPAYWRERGWPDLCYPVGDDDFECDKTL
ncbi:MAG: hypothetical protein IIA05_12425 [Proteobacteria bacterium]|nr:hypothetical protein [Pseudomonadota bacterium]